MLAIKVAFSEIFDRNLGRAFIRENLEIDTMSALDFTPPQTSSTDSPYVHRKVRYAVAIMILMNVGKIQAFTSFPALYGNGFDSLKLEHKPTACIQGTKLEEQVTNVHSYFNKVKSWSSLQAELDFGVPGAVYFKSGGALAKFVLKARDNRFTSTYVLRNRIVTKRMILTEPKVTFIAEEDDFRANCGDKYINLVETGGELFVGIKLYFSHAEYKDQFEVGGNIETITSLNSRIASLTEDVKTDAAVEVFSIKSVATYQN